MSFSRYVILFFLLPIISFLYGQEEIQSFTPTMDSQLSIPVSSSSCSKVDSIIQFALSQKGKKYKYGTSGPNSFDCSGFIYYTYNQFGIQIGRSSRDQYQQGVKIELNDVQPGDLVFFYRGKRSKKYIGHVAMVISVDSSHNFSFVHASTPKTGVRIDNSSRAGYVNSIVGARRIVQCDGSYIPQNIISESNNQLSHNIKSVKSENSNSKSSSSNIYYVVKQGDTLYSISKKHKLPIDQILQKNKLKSDKIYPGQKLKL